MPAWITKLIDNSIQEAQTGLIIESLNYLFKCISWWSRSLIWILLNTLIGQVEDNCTDDIRIYLSSAIHDLFTLLHFSTDFNDQLWVPGPIEIVKILP